MGIKPLTSLEQFGARMWPFRLLGAVVFLVFSTLVMWADLNPWIAALCIGGGEATAMAVELID